MNNDCVVAGSHFRALIGPKIGHRAFTAVALALISGATMLAAWTSTGPGPRMNWAATALPPAQRQAQRPQPQLLQATANEAATEPYPAARVREVRPADHAPEPYYLRNRVILRSLRMQAVGAGVQISGDLFADFDCDVPPAEAKLARGQIQGLVIEVGLYDRTPLLERDQFGNVKLPNPRPTQAGQLVQGQSVQCSTTGTLEGFGHAQFTLPPLERPLAPGVYELVAKLAFQAQGRTQQEQIKWCSGFWGAEDMGLVDGLRNTRPVIGNQELHARYWKELLEVTRLVKSEARLYLGDTRGKSGPNLRGPAASNDRNPANVLIWTPQLDVIERVEGLPTQRSQSLETEKQRLNDPDFMAARLKQLQLRNPKATMADAIKDVKEEGKRERALIDALVAQDGGPATAQESRLLASSIAGRATVLAATLAFQDRLKYVTWVLLDGLLIYQGFQTIDRAGANAWNAIDKNDANAARVARLDRQKATDEKVLQTRAEASKRQPPELWAAYTAHLKQRDDTPDFDPSNFTRKRDGKLVLNVEGWARFRDTWTIALDKALQPWMNELDTSVGFINRTMPEVVGEVLEARRQLTCLGYAYEYSIRTHLGKEDAATIAAEWQKLAGDDKELDRLMNLSRTDRNTVKTRYDSHIAAARKLASVEEFRVRWRTALDKGGALPGGKGQ